VDIIVVPLIIGLLVQLLPTAAVSLVVIFAAVTAINARDPRRRAYARNVLRTVARILRPRSSR
jgi:hypothetical protein